MSEGFPTLLVAFHIIDAIYHLLWGSCIENRYRMSQEIMNTRLYCISRKDIKRPTLLYLLISLLSHTTWKVI